MSLSSYVGIRSYVGRKRSSNYFETIVALCFLSKQFLFVRTQFPPFKRVHLQLRTTPPSIVALAHSLLRCYRPISTQHGYRFVILELVHDLMSASWGLAYVFRARSHNVHQNQLHFWYSHRDLENFWLATNFINFVFFWPPSFPKMMNTNANTLRLAAS